MRRRYSEINRKKYRLKKCFAVLLCLALCFSSVSYEHLTVAAEEGSEELIAGINEDGDLEIDNGNNEGDNEVDNENNNEDKEEELEEQPEIDEDNGDKEQEEQSGNENDNSEEELKESEETTETETDQSSETEIDTEESTESETETETETETEEEETTETETTEDIVEKFISDISACTKASELYALFTGDAYTEFTEYISDLTEEEQNSAQTALEQALSELFSSSEFEWDDADAKEYFNDKYPNLVPQTSTKKKARAKVQAKTVSIEPMVADNDYIYFDLALGNVTINDDEISGYVYVQKESGTETSAVEEDDDDSEEEESSASVQYTAELKEYENNTKKIYVYQSNGSPSTANNWSTDGLPIYDRVTYNGQSWGKYITNNTDVEDVINNWVSASERTATENYITISGSGTFDITIDNLYSSAQTNKLGYNTTDGNGGIVYTPGSNGKVTINFKGDNRFARIHYGANESVGSKIVFTGCTNDATLTAADMKGNESYNYVTSAIGGILSGNSYGMYFTNGIIYAGATVDDACTAIGAGGNGSSEIYISDDAIVTAVANTTGTAIGGGSGSTKIGGSAKITISGGKVYAYNYGRSSDNKKYINIPVAAIGAGSSSDANGAYAEINISGGTVYAESAGGTAIGGGSSAKVNGGEVKVTISGNADVTARSTKGASGSTLPAGAGIGGGTGGTGGNGGDATVNISGSAKVTTGSIGGGKTNANATSSSYYAGNAKVTINGSPTIQGQIVMESGSQTEGSFTMSGGTIDNSDIEDYSPLQKNGGALYIKNGTAKITGGTIQNCSATDGGAVYIEYSGTEKALKMSGGTIKNCSATNGGALCIKSGTAEISGGTIENCSATYGGALYIESGTAQITDGTIGNCSATDGGAIYINYSDTGNAITMSGGTLKENTASGNGGAIYVSASQASDADKNLIEIKGGTLSDNKATKQGGAIYVNSTEAINMLVSSGTISNNTANGKGGAIGIESTNTDAKINLTIGDSVKCSTSTDNSHSHPTIDSNTALEGGGGIYLSSGTITMYCGELKENKGVGTVANDVLQDGGTFNNINGTVATLPTVNGGDYNIGSETDERTYYKVIYHANYKVSEGEIDTKEITFNTVNEEMKITLSDSAFTRDDGYYLVGWRTSTSDSDSKTLTGEIDLAKYIEKTGDSNSDNTEDGSKENPYTINFYAVWKQNNSSYEVKIPAELTISDSDASNESTANKLEIIAKLTNFRTNEYLYIQVTSQNNFNLKLKSSNNSSAVSYALYKDSTKLTNDGIIVASVSDVTNDNTDNTTTDTTTSTVTWKKTLTAQLTGTPAYAGSYYDTLTFTISKK